MSDTTAAKPLDFERARLRAKGFSEEEIREYLLRKEMQEQPQSSSGAAAGAAVAGQGVLSGVLNSLVAVMAHARDTVFSIRKDVETLFTTGAPLSVRAGATASLAVKAAVVGVLGYAGWQEWQQHIIAAPESARQQTINLTEQAKNAAVREKATADNAAQQAQNAERREAAIAESAVAEAQIKEATARETLRRQKAEADEAQARACSARAEAEAKNMHIGDFLNGNYRGDPTLARDCDPNYAHREACDEQFKAIFAPVDTFTLYDPRFSTWVDTLDKKLTAHIAECGELTQANKKLAQEKYHIIQTVVAPQSSTPEVKTSSPAFKPTPPKSSGPDLRCPDGLPWPCL